MIFAFLEEIVTFQVSFTSINIWELSLQRPLIWAFIVRSNNEDKSCSRCKSQRRKRSGLKHSSNNPPKSFFEYLTTEELAEPEKRSGATTSVGTTAEVEVYNAAGERM